MIFRFCSMPLLVLAFWISVLVVSSGFASQVGRIEERSDDAPAVR